MAGGEAPAGLEQGNCVGHERAADAERLGHGLLGRKRGARGEPVAAYLLQ